VVFRRSQLWNLGAKDERLQYESILGRYLSPVGEVRLGGVRKIYCPLATNPRYFWEDYMGLIGTTAWQQILLKICEGRNTCLFNDNVICEYCTVFMVDELKVMEACCQHLLPYHHSNHQNYGGAHGTHLDRGTYCLYWNLYWRFQHLQEDNTRISATSGSCLSLNNVLNKEGKPSTLNFLPLLRVIIIIIIIIISFFLLTDYISYTVWLYMYIFICVTWKLCRQYLSVYT
jgi:hypothetical protein